MTATLALAELDIASAQAALTTRGRARVDGFLAGDGAERLLAAMTDPAMVWMRAIHNPYNADVPLAVFEAEPVEEQARLVGMALSEATDGFQFIFDRLRIGQARAVGLQAPPALFELHELLNSPAFLAWARRLTGDDRIAYADAQATRYLPGHFLNGHDDRHEDAGRLYAYVLNLCPRWRPEWGGLLAFLRGEGAGEPEVVETFTPGWNVLNVFRVPQAHAVTYVSPFAGAARHSITGWWRTTPPPGRSI